MGKIILVLGPTGSGKSRSVKNLDPKKTFIVNVLGSKDLPFKGSRKLYNKENKNIRSLTDYTKIVSTIEQVSAKKPDVTTIVIDDARYIMEKEFMKRAGDVGYAKFTEIAQHFQQVIEAGEKARKDLVVVLMLHDDDVINDKVIVKKKVKTVGKMVDDHYNPLEVVSICLYCKPTFEKSGKPTYQFYTQAVVLNGVEIPAKTPEDMFEEVTIPNDLAIVIKAMNEYF